MFAKLQGAVPIVRCRTTLHYARMASSATGVAFTPFETRVDTMLRLALRAEALDLDRVQVAEAWTHDATILLAELAAQTSRIGLGTGVISVWGRTPASIALAAAGLQRACGGRFSLGLGAGSPPLTEGLHGVRWERPVARVRETLIAVRALLAGERLPHPAAGARPLRLGVSPTCRCRSRSRRWRRRRFAWRGSWRTNGRRFCGHARG